MNTHELLIAGFGGQGVLTAGQLLAFAGNAEGRQVSWVPAYGPEQRGGTANCSVVISDQPVACPLVTEPTACIVMNQPSLDKFEPLVRPGGILLFNSSLCTRPPSRSDLTVLPVAASELAISLGTVRVANMVAVGALLGLLPLVQEESVLVALVELMGSGKANLVPLNRQALQEGRAVARGFLNQQATGVSGS